jgi:long-chain fatty acid transport protein
MHAINRPDSAIPAAAALTSLLAFLFAAPAGGAGAWMTENGGPDMPMASAGRAAFATDGTTIAANPAGLAGLQGSGLVVAALPVTLDLEFEGTGDTAGRTSNRSGTLPMASAFATTRSGRWGLGLGAYGTVGLGCDFDRGWSGSRAIEEAQLGTLNLAPALAYRLTERLDVGASVGAQFATAQAGLAVGSDAMYYGAPAAMPDGRLRMSGHSWAPVANLGLVYRTEPGATLGLAWSSAVAHSMDLDAHANGLHPALGAMLQQQGPATLEVRMPQQVTASIAVPLDRGTLVAASAGWQQWSTFGEASLRVADHAAPLFEDGLDDTWSVALGVRQRLDSRWTLAGGVAYDSDPSASGTMPIYFPVAEQLRLALGADYRASDSLLLRGSVSLINQGEVRIEQVSHPLPLPGMPAVTGTVHGSRIYVLGLTAAYRP